MAPSKPCAARKPDLATFLARRLLLPSAMLLRVAWIAAPVATNGAFRHVGNAALVERPRDVIMILARHFPAGLASRRLGVAFAFDPLLHLRREHELRFATTALKSPIRHFLTTAV
eukprot:CAMPEP_0118945968 /NCGR_PEP_ID=MMETSP1169-20130426/43349_1 /TAXON_ID=36882 /ORGANISM="Pyramimonas obovata, Strain CCMP722" /LENGTH=114 /DNA_ID=CAMNT_0006891821 /DNA_START=24 /DNA_END=368 /DNA_ORIENTATION=-